jgi:hypothetical protein
MRLNKVLPVALAISLVLIGKQARAQATPADYQRASEVGKKYAELALNLPEAPVWIEGSDAFMYRKTVDGGHAFVQVDAGAQAKQAAFDHAKMAAA